jgi:hypothetical protein
MKDQSKWSGANFIKSFLAGSALRELALEANSKLAQTQFTIRFSLQGNQKEV